MCQSSVFQFEDLTNTNCSDPSLSKNNHMSQESQESPGTDSPREKKLIPELLSEYDCIKCKTTQLVANFSNNQLRRDHEGNRKCKDCTAELTASRLAAGEAAKASKKERREEKERKKKPVTKNKVSEGEGAEQKKRRTRSRRKKASPEDGEGEAADKPASSGANTAAECSGCSLAIGKANFSKNQWSLGPLSRKCKACVDIKQAERAKRKAEEAEEEDKRKEEAEA